MIVILFHFHLDGLIKLFVLVGLTSSLDYVSTVVKFNGRDVATGNEVPVAIFI